MNRHVERRDIECLEHDLRHLLSVYLGIERSLGEEDRVFLRGDAQFVEEGMVPNLLHVIPVGNNPVLNRILESENTTLSLGLIADNRNFRIRSMCEMCFAYPT